MRIRTLACNPAIDVGRTLHLFRRGPQDPTMRLGPRESWRAARTPDGPATTRFVGEGTRVRLTAWGPGADFALQHAVDLLGLERDPRDFVPRHPVMREAHRRFISVRDGRTGRVTDAIIPSILEQKVHSSSAFNSYARLVRKFGDRAPGPLPLWVAPDPRAIAQIPYWQLHRLGIERKRANTIINACSYHRKLDELADLRIEEAYRRMTALPGVGAWTAAEVARNALGDPDAVSVGDLHLPNTVAWALAAEPRADDERMLELLEPYRGKRTRAVRLVELLGMRAPRYGPRTVPASIANI